MVYPEDLLLLKRLGVEVEQQEDIQKTASILQSGSVRGRSSENDREDVDQEVPVSDIST